MAKENDSWDDSSSSDDSKDAATITSEQQEILDKVAASGVSVDELTGRAARDYKREREDAGQPKPDPKKEDAGSGDKAMTKEEIEATVRNTTQNQIAVANNQQRFRERIAVIARSETGLGKNVSARKLRSIEDDIATELQKNLNLSTLSQTQFDEELDKVTKQVVADERKEALEMVGSDETADLAGRLAAQATAGNSGKSGGVSNKHSVPSGGDDGISYGELSDNPEEQEFGMDTKWHSDDQAANIRDREMTAFDKSNTAGRT